MHCQSQLLCRCFPIPPRPLNRDPRNALPRPQKEMWIQNQRRWPKFFKAIDWVQGENAVYRKWPAEFNYSYEATKGHMPLTNALRGTQLFEAIFQHPAFDKSAAAGGSGKKSIDELSREAGANTLKW